MTDQELCVRLRQRGGWKVAADRIEALAADNERLQREAENHRAEWATAMQDIVRLKAALRDWQLGKGDTEIEAENARLRDLLRRVGQRLDSIVFYTAFSHGVRYAGPTWEELRREIEATLSEKGGKVDGLAGDVASAWCSPDPEPEQPSNVLVIDAPRNDARATIIAAMRGEKGGTE